MGLHTKNGRPLQVHGDKVYSRCGQIIGRIKDDRVFGTDGRYVGTIDNDRLVYRSIHTACVHTPFAVANRNGMGLSQRFAAAIWGDEPDIPG